MKAHRVAIAITLIPILAVLVAVGTWLSATILPAYSHARHSCEVIERFGQHVENSNWDAARAMLATSDLQLRDGKVLYGDSDVTDLFKGTKPEFWDTFEYYLTDPYRSISAKAVFLHGYVLLEDGKISCVKIP